MDKDKKILGTDGKIVTSNDDTKTHRSKVRDKEDQNYIPVIIKRTDEAIRHPGDILERAIEEGLEQHQRPNLSLFLSAIAAGLILGFAGMCVALMSQLFPASENLMVHRLAVALVYPLGFIICIMSGTQLFTEHTATAVYPVLDRKAKIKSLFLLWSIVLLGNFVGTFISSYLIYSSDNVIVAGTGFIDIADHLIHYKPAEVLMSAILAGWLMAQGGWLVLATPPASSQVICIFIVTFIIGFAGLHHSIVGSAEIFAGLFHADEPKFFDSFKFLVFAVVGNLIGGSLFVGVLNYGHIKKLNS
jgi:formate/nitrite transporter FocA (FNT family)